MHELSIAAAILELARRATPNDSALSCVHVIAGPMRAIDEDAMQFAWQAVVADAGLINLRLDFRTNPWRLRCPRCDAQWSSADSNSDCTRCRAAGWPIGGDELQLVAIDVEEMSKGVTPCE